MTIFIVIRGSRDGSFGGVNEKENEIAFTSNEKAEDYIESAIGVRPDEDGFVKFNIENYPHNGHDDEDYEYYCIKELELEG